MGSKGWILKVLQEEMKGAERFGRACMGQRS